MTLFDDPFRRSVVFLVFCIGARTGLAFAASRPAYMSDWRARYPMCLFAGVAALGWLDLYRRGARMDAVEAGPSGTWWNGLRPVHAGLYLAFVVMAMAERARAYAWAPLAADVVVAITAWVWFRRWEN